ncbi:uncharacterized protein [Drosophila tropicalis]|uniref:uncharacterized protein isoform X2 n=1 Tax=Drosophila tropicalis TaxID=46794 RepID=UPI0035AB7E3A
MIDYGTQRQSNRNMNDQLFRLQPLLENQQIHNEIAGLPMLNRIMNRERLLEDMELNFGRQALAFDENEVASDEEPNLADSDSIDDSDDDDDADELNESLFSIRNACPKRRAPHTMPGYGVDEHVTQPILWLALEQLRKHENMLKQKRQTGAAAVGQKKITSPADFVANYLIKNMTLDIFKNGNQPRYGPGLFSRRPLRRRMNGLRAL